MRIRKHVANNVAELVRRAGAFEPLAKYIRAGFKGSGQHAFLEASVSDFGLGILDHFLSSEKGERFRSTARREVLQKILLEPLSAKLIDEGAGQGLRNALHAARDMGGFVSLRAGEFWLVQSYAQPDAAIALHDVDDIRRQKVAGTHWQFFWPQPLP